jgi:hypothetical protein
LVGSVSLSPPHNFFWVCFSDFFFYGQKNSIKTRWSMNRLLVLWENLLKCHWSKVSFSCSIIMPVLDWLNTLLLIVHATYGPFNLFWESNVLSSELFRILEWEVRLAVGFENLLSYSPWFVFGSVTSAHLIWLLTLGHYRPYFHWNTLVCMSFGWITEPSWFVKTKEAIVRFMVLRFVCVPILLRWTFRLIVHVYWLNYLGWLHRPCVGPVCYSFFFSRLVHLVAR